MLPARTSSEPGETADAALRREVREETGLRVMGESPEAFRAASIDGDTCHLAVTISCQWTANY